MKIDIPAFKHYFIGGTSLLTAYFHNIQNA